MTYTQLRARVKEYKDAGYTSIKLNSSYLELAREYVKMVDLNISKL